MKSFRKVCRGQKGQKGFTLIELLVVIIILGVLAAVVTLAVTRFIGKGTLESANAEFVTVQTAIEACLADANASQLNGAVSWTGDNATSPKATAPDGVTIVSAYDMMRTHKFKAVYAVAVDGEVMNGTPAGGLGGGWGTTKIEWSTPNVAGGEWIKYTP